MISLRTASLATTALVGNLLLAAGAYAQSTGTSSVETVVVTGSFGPNTVGGLIQEETVAKSRTTVDQQYIESQSPGQTVLQVLNLAAPGLNFTNNDPYGSSGGNIRLHGFDGNRVALTFDGMPLNDTGNYAVYTNQLLDGELISKAQVNTGSTDVDSPTAASTGGTINFASLTPGVDPKYWFQASAGEYSYQRYMAFVQPGEVGPWGTRMWGAVSWQNYDKFKGEGELYKRQFNAKIYQPLGGNNFISVAAHYNINRNNNYYGASLAVVDTAGNIITKEETATDPAGWEIDYRTEYQPDTVTTKTGLAGDIDQAENTQNGATRGYYGLRINPSNTGNLRIQSRFDIGEKFTVTIDPSFQYVLANGGTQNTTLWESCNGSTTSNTAANCPTLTRQLLGSVNPSTNRGVDLNGDGDVNDLVRVMNPSNTNTRRFGLITALIYRLTDDQLFRFNYTLDYGRHRQTGEFGLIDPVSHRYINVFGGKDGHGPKIGTADGVSFMRNRDRASVAELNQFSLEYRGNFFDDALQVNVGVRAPYFKRELNQFCYSQNGSSNVRCTTEQPSTTLANGNVQFTGGTTQYIAPYSKTLKFDDVLPNVGVSYNLGDNQFYATYAESTSLPRTDNLYTAFRLADGSIGNPAVQPETSSTGEIGYRYGSKSIIATASAWATSFENRIVSSFDQDLGLFIDRNVGKVDQWGVDGSIGWQPADNFAAYFNASYNESELQQDIQASATTILLTKGKTLVETPDVTYAVRLEWEPATDFSLGLQGKYVGERWVTDVNDLKVDSYVITDFDLTYRLDELGFKGSSIRFNVNNLFDEKYYGSIGSTNSATSGAVGFSRPFANVGAPRTATLTLRGAF